MFPEIFESGPDPVVISSVHKFSRKEHILSTSKAMHTSQIGWIMMRIPTVIIRPRVNYNSVLRVMLLKVVVQFVVPSTFISLIPNDHRRMVYITIYHFLNQLRSCFGIVPILPTGEFVEHKKSQRITGSQKMIIRRIMKTHCIHIHILYQVYIHHADAFAGTAATFGPNAVTVNSFHHDLSSVQVNTVAFSKIKRSKTDAFRNFVHGFPIFLQFQFQRI